MSIDAVIERIRERPEGRRLELAPRVGRDGEDTIPGQPSLTILGKFAFEPKVGNEIWGNASSCMIGGAVYDRRGVFLREKRLCPRCDGEMHWALISNEATGKTRDVRFCETCGYEEPVD